MSLFIFVQILRNPHYFSKFSHLFESSGISKIFMFSEIEKAINDTEFLTNRLNYFINNEWNIYITKEYPLPLSDFPFVEDESSIKICLAPDLLLEIIMNGQDRINNYMMMTESKYKEIIKGILKNSKHNIVFSDDRYFNSL